MGRKGAKKQRQLGEEEYRYQRGVTEPMRAERREAREELRPQFQTLLDESFGYRPEGYQPMLFTPRQRQNILSTGIRSARLPYESAADQAAQRLARTRNPAGYGGLLGELTRGKSRSMADVARRTEAGLSEAESREQFRRMDWLERERLQRRYAGLEGLSRLYGIDTQLLAGQLGRGGIGLQAHAAGIEPGLMETLVSPVVGGAATGGAMYAGKKLFG